MKKIYNFIKHLIFDKKTFFFSFSFNPWITIIALEAQDKPEQANVLRNQFYEFLINYIIDERYSLDDTINEGFAKFNWTFTEADIDQAFNEMYANNPFDLNPALLSEIYNEYKIVLAKINGESDQTSEGSEASNGSEGSDADQADNVLTSIKDFIQNHFEQICIFLIGSIVLFFIAYLITLFPFWTTMKPTPILPELPLEKNTPIDSTPIPATIADVSVSNNIIAVNYAYLYLILGLIITLIILYKLRKKI